MPTGRIRSASLLTIVVLVSATPAVAGGSTLQFAEREYPVGAVAYGVAAVAYDHNPDLGRPDEGPYYLYLARPESGSPVAERAWPHVPAGAVRVATLQFREGPVQEPGTAHLTGPDHVVVEFTVPALPPGEYASIVCDDPCESSLGDIVHGRFVIASGPRSPNALPVTLAAGHGEGSARRIVGVASGALLAAGTVALVARRRRRPASSTGRDPRR